MKRNVPLKSIMTRDVATVNVSQKLSDVRKLIADRKIHHVPVVSGTMLVGLISATDLVRLSFSAYGADQRAVDAMLDHEFSIDGVMIRDLVTLREQSTIREAAKSLSTGAFHSVPVVDDDGNLLGLVTSTDLIRYLAEQLGAH